MKKAKARREKNTRQEENRDYYLPTSNEDVWAHIENGVNLHDNIDFYDTTKEDLLVENLEVDEDFVILDSPYNNYALTTNGRMWSYKTDRWMRLYYRKNSVKTYLNSNVPVNIRDLFEEYGWVYNHEEVTNYLDELDLLTEYK